MKLSKKLLKALVEQVNMEFASGYLYRSMSHDMKNLRQQCDMGILLRNSTLEIFDNIDDAIRIYQDL